MRTTVDLPDDLHGIAMAIARDTGRTLSETVAGLMRTGLSRTAASEVVTSQSTGLPTVRLGGGPITVDDVRALDDAE